ncbi:hypothetical protein QTP70_014963, partial [Hemibagrus guttatus]
MVSGFEFTGPLYGRNGLSSSELEFYSFMMATIRSDATP